MHRLLQYLRLFALMAACLLPSAACYAAPPADENQLSLAGSWQVRLDNEDEGLTGQWYAKLLQTNDTAKLPGSLAQSGLGHPYNPETGRYDGFPNPPFLRWPAAGYTPEHRRDELGVLVADRMTLGAAWFERTITVPKSFEGRSVRLHMERVKWSSRVWVDGKEIQPVVNESLHTPHLYDLGVLAPGKHRLTVRIDNRPVVHMGIAGHGYGGETEPIWLGAVGDLFLAAQDTVRVNRARVLPAENRRSVKVDLELAADENAPRGVRLTAQIVDSKNNDRIIGQRQRNLSADDLNGRVSIDIDLRTQAEAWDEFNPRLYGVRWEISTPDESIHEGSRRVGFRTVKRDGNRLLMNGKPLFLRGNLDCAIHPESQTPPTDRAWWERVLRIHKEAGFNHIRFHTWCPPEVAFDVADEMGMYFQIETAYWVDDWIRNTLPNPHALGSNAEVDAWVEQESMDIIRTYEHHPSFVMFCIGNEFGFSQTDWKKVNQIVTRLNAATDHALVTAACARRALAGDEYWVTHNSNGATTRGIGPAHTNWDFSQAVRATDMPVIAHETGQAPSWPDLDAMMPRFSGVMQPWNLQQLREEAEAAGADDHERRARASAMFANVTYKSESEAHRRTRGMVGYQLLMLHDFTGQGEALVGLLDAFYHEKPGITLKDIRAWNGPTVPMARFDRYAWQTTETFKANIQVAHEGPGPMKTITPRWTLKTESGQVVGQGTLPKRNIPDYALTDLGEISVPLNKLTKPTAMTLTVEVGGIENHWNLWAYPPASDRALQAKGDVHVTRTMTNDTLACLENGESVVLLPHGSFLPGSRRMGFRGVYWTGAWGQNGGTGLLIDSDHPALAGFPTKEHSDWQWQGVTQGAMSIPLPKALGREAMIVENLKAFHHPEREGAVFEMRVGEGKLLVCGFDLINNLEQRHAARAMRRSLLAYAASDQFNPKVSMSPETVSDFLMGETFGDSGVAVIATNSEQPGNEAKNVLDGDSSTIWHTRWGAIQPPHPHHLTLDLGEVREVVGLRFLPRQDGTQSGQFRDVAIFVSDDGQNWGRPIYTQRLGNSQGIATLRFEKSETRFVKIEIRSEINGQPWASLAELEVLYAE